MTFIFCTPTLVEFEFNTEALMKCCNYVSACLKVHKFTDVRYNIHIRVVVYLAYKTSTVFRWHVEFLLQQSLTVKCCLKRKCF